MSHDTDDPAATAPALLPGGTEAGTAGRALVPLLADYLTDVSRRTAERLGTVVGVAVTLAVDSEPWTVGASSALALEVDLLQYEIGTGPCLLALHQGVLSYVPDLAADQRWGDYGPRAADRGVASCLSVPVLVAGQPAAVLKVYSSEVDGLSADQQAVARTAAVEVSGGVGLAASLQEHAQLLDDREAAMHSRRVIDLALGVLMERTQCDAAQAFASLRTVSQHANVKLASAAQQVLTSLPGVGEDDTRAPFRRRGERPRDGSVRSTAAF